jgi:PAS domain S-box-containing protein
MSDQKLQILIVEDDELDRMIIRRALKSSGINMEVSFAEDHQSGFAATIQKNYDCIFLDNNLPDGTGIELLSAIRASGNNSPIIIVTSHGDEKVAVAAMKSGATDYIPKSLLSPEGLAQSLRYVIRFKEAELEKARIEIALQESEKRLQTVVAHSPIILFAFDSEGVFTLFEGKGVENLGADKNRIIGKSIHSYRKMFPQIMDIYEKTMRGEEVTTVLELHGRFYQAFYAPVRDYKDNITGVIGVSSDITDHVKAEEELKKAKQLAEETSRIKERFLANMSHEIRTPMNGIIGLTHILLNTKLDDEQVTYLNSIKSSSDNLLVIVNDVLDFSKIEAGRMNFEKVPFNLQEIAQNSIDLFKVKADEKKILLDFKIDSSIPSVLYGDPTRLGQILNNLVGNAVKFTQQGEVVLKVSLRSKRDNNVTLDAEVCDTGIGIPAESINQIFNSFTQGSDDTTRRFGGTGLGLTIVKNLIELQGGTIGVKSKEGSGTTFFFHLTYEFTSQENHIDQDKAKENNQSLSHLKILIAEDNAINQMIVRKILTGWKIQVDCADNGLVAIEMLNKETYDLILMDIQMPEMDGYTATKKIRQELKYSIPILAMTAHAAPTEKQKCFDFGMNDYISKPFNPPELKNKIIELTKQHKKILQEKKNTGMKSRVDQLLTETKKMNPEKPALNERDNSLTKADLPFENPRETKPVSESDAKIDLSYLKEIAEGNDAFIIEMIETFLQKTPEALEKLNESFQKQNWEQLRLIAHRIKPSYSYVGLPEIQIMLSEIESCSLSKTDLEKIPVIISQVKHTSVSAFNDLKKELNGMK